MKLENNWSSNWLILFTAQDVMAGTMRQMTTHWLKIKADILADVSRSMANVRWQFAGYYQIITSKWWRDVEDDRCFIELTNWGAWGLNCPPGLGWIWDKYSYSITAYPFPSPLISKPSVGSIKSPLISKMSFWCLQISQKTNKNFVRISDLASKKSQIKK